MLFTDIVVYMVDSWCGRCRGCVRRNWSANVLTTTDNVVFTQCETRWWFIVRLIIAEFYADHSLIVILHPSTSRLVSYKVILFFLSTNNSKFKTIYNDLRKKILKAISALFLKHNYIFKNNKNLWYCFHIWMIHRYIFIIFCCSY